MVRRTAASATPEALARGAELLAGAVAAHGGEELLAAFESVRQKASATAFAQGQELAVAVDQIVVYPDRLHQSVTLPQGTMVQVATPETAENHGRSCWYCALENLSIGAGRGG